MAEAPEDGQTGRVAAGVDFTPAAWAALFPENPPRLPPDLPESLAPLAFPAAVAYAQREDPMTADRLLAGLGDSPLSRFLVRLLLFLAPQARFPVVPSLVSLAVRVFFVALVFVFNDGRFGTRQLAAMVAAFAVH